MKTKALALLFLLAAFTLVAACGGDDDDDQLSADSATIIPCSADGPCSLRDGGEDGDEHTEDEHDDLIASGRQVYLDVGCAQCHGQDAEGSMMAPALAGHTSEQIERQVRNPVGMMPGYDEDALGEEDLEALTAYIDSLEGDHGHAFDERAPESAHLLMMLIALKADDLAETQHHLSHAREFIDDEDIQGQLEDLEAMLKSGDMHDAEHILEDMLEGTDVDEAAMATLHLEVAIQALRFDDPDDARHHLEHGLEGDLSAEEEAAIREAINAIEAGDLHDAEDLINDLLGESDHDEG